MAAASTAVVEQLKEKILKLQAQPRELVMALRTGHEALDAFGVFRLGGAVELCGEEASGRTTVAISVVAAAGKEKRLSAWVDGPSELFPPAAASLGVDLKRLLIVRPPSPSQLVWAAMQLLRSGAFTCVVLDVLHTGLRLGMTDAKKLLDAARAGGSLLVVLTAQTAPAQGFVRLMMKTQSVSPAGLRTLHVVREGPVACAPVFEVEAPHGRKTSVPSRAWRSRQVTRPWVMPEVMEVVPRASHQRPRKNLARDGYGLLWGRPGRDGPLVIPRPAAR